MYNNFDHQLGGKEQFRQFSLRVVPGATNIALLPGPQILAINTTSSEMYTKESALLPEQHSVVVNQRSGGITLVDWRNGRFLAYHNLSDDQLPAILYLLEEWPSYVSYEKMLRRYGNELTDQQLEDLERVKESGYAGETEEEKVLDKQARERIAPLMNPLRTLLASCNLCLREFGIKIAAVMDCGPILMKTANKQAIMPPQNVN